MTAPIRRRLDALERSDNSEVQCLGRDTQEVRFDDKQDGRW